MRNAANAKPTNPKDATLGLIFGLIGVAIFGGTLPATSAGVTDFSPEFLTFARAAIATVLAALLFLVFRRRFPSEDLKSLAISGLLLVYGFPGFMALAMQTVPSGHGGVVLGILPLLTAMLAKQWMGETPSPLFWACGITGTLLVTLFALRESGFGFSIGDFWLVCSAISAACGYVIFGRLTQKMPGWEVISWALILAAPITFLGTFFTWQPQFINAQPLALGGLAYASVFSMLIGFFFWNEGLARGGVARVGQLQLLQPFFTLAIAGIILGETITLEMVAFALAVIALVAIGRRG